MWGGALFAGALLGGVLGHGSVTIDSGSPWLYVVLGTTGLAISLDIAAYAAAPGPYHPPGTVVGLSTSGTRVLSAAWRF